MKKLSNKTNTAYKFGNKYILGCERILFCKRCGKETTHRVIINKNGFDICTDCQFVH